jgi:hypothetical protein
MDYEIKFNNKEVFEFYASHNLDAEFVNVSFINILKKLMNNLDTSVNSNLATKLLETCTALDHKIDNLNSSVNKYQQDITNVITIKLTEYRKEYIDDLKLILSSNNVDCISPLIKETNNNLLDKTSLLLNEILPKNQNLLTKDIFSYLQQFQTSLSSETNKLLSSSLDKNTIDEFLKNMNLSFGQSQQTLTTIISSSETRIENRLYETERKMNEIKEISTLNQSSQQLLQSNVSEILKKFEKGSTKGNISEHITYNILLSLFPCATIDHVGNEQKETGDIILIRNNKPKILIENKDHDTKNVTKQEVDKFIRDCEIQNCCGIMFAQHRGICNKENFELQIHKGNVLLYVHNVNFDNEKIRNSIEVVENFKMKLDEININENDCIIEQSVLEQINKEYVEYITQKNSMVKLLKDFGEKMIYSINELKMPTLDKYLSSRFAFSTIQNEGSCKYCEAHSLKSVKSHERYCSAKKAYDLLHPSEVTSDDGSLSESLAIEIPENIIISSISHKKDKKDKSKDKKDKPEKERKEK